MGEYTQSIWWKLFLGIFFGVGFALCSHSANYRLLCVTITFFMIHRNRKYSFTM